MAIITAQVLNQHLLDHQAFPGEVKGNQVYIGRPSKWGNPYVWSGFLATQPGCILVKDREEAIARYKAWFFSQPELVWAAKQELKGKDLVCWCAPASCHGDILLAWANS